MLSKLDTYGIRRDMQDSRSDYRPVTLVYPNITTGSGYEPFTDAPYDITSGSIPAYGVTTYTSYIAHARVKIIQADALMGGGASVAGVQIGDYLMFFRLEDEGQLNRMMSNEHGYMICDGTTFRPEGVNISGVARGDDIMVHAKRYTPRFRARGL